MKQNVLPTLSVSGAMLIHHMVEAVRIPGPLGLECAIDYLCWAVEAEEDHLVWINRLILRGELPGRLT